MKLGVCLPTYGETLSVDGLRTVALEAERLGYDSVWTTDHVLMPRQSGTPYERILDSVTCLAYLAPITRTVKLGISSLILAMRNPVVVAKQLATIDQLSGGRLMLATSAGWVEREFSHLGSNFHNRGKRLDDSIRLIRTLWSAKGDAEFEPKSIPQRFGKAVFEPPPIQKHLSIWIAGSSEAAMKRAIALGDAWHPNVTPSEAFRDLVARFRSLPGGKDVPICVRIALNTRFKESEYVGITGERRVILSGNVDDNRKMVAELRTLGVSYMLVAPNVDGKVRVEDQVASLRTISENFVRTSNHRA